MAANHFVEYNELQMKANPGDRLVKKSFKTCEFNCEDGCGGHGERIDKGKDTYGMEMKVAMKMFA